MLFQLEQLDETFSNSTSFHIISSMTITFKSDHSWSKGNLGCFIAGTSVQIKLPPSVWDFIDSNPVRTKGFFFVPA